MTAAAGTLVLARREISDLMRPADWLAAVETGFRAAADGRAHAPPPMHVEGSGGAFHAKGARLVLDRLYVALKLNGNFPANPCARGLPTVQGAVLLCDGETGALLSLMDSIEITLRRTAAATALAARYLARPDSRFLLVCGCGAQGRAHVAALREALPLEKVLFWDQDERASARLAAEEQGLEAAVVTDLPAAARSSDVIVTCTTSDRPYLGVEDVPPGAFIAAVGADSPDKNEIRPELMAAAQVVADVLDQSTVMGDLHHALAAGAMGVGQVHAELAELVTGAKVGRADSTSVTLFDSTGTAIEDVAAAAAIYARALLRSGLPTVDLAA